MGAFWITKRGVDYLQQRYPDTPLLEALSNAWSDANSPTPPAVTTTAPKPVAPVFDVSAEKPIPPPENRITPYPTTDEDVRADFNPNVGTSAEPVIEPQPQPELITPDKPKSGIIYALLVGINDLSLIHI